MQEPDLTECICTLPLGYCTLYVTLPVGVSSFFFFCVCGGGGGGGRGRNMISFSCNKKKYFSFSTKRECRNMERLDPLSH